MVAYRRSRIPGGTYFFTLALQDRSGALLIEHIDALRASFVRVRQRWPFETIAMVVLRDHVHAIWTLPAGDADYSTRWRLIKAGFAHSLRQRGVHVVSRGNGERGIWQRRFWEHTIRDECDLRRHVDYVHFNPVKHGLVGAVRDWPYSTFHRYVRRGVLSLDWAAPPEVSTTSQRAFGE